MFIKYPFSLHFPLAFSVGVGLCDQLFSKWIVRKSHIFVQIEEIKSQCGSNILILPVTGTLCPQWYNKAECVCVCVCVCARARAQLCPTLLRPHGLQPTRFLCPWNFPGKNTGVGCHFLLQCMKVKRESEVAQSCLTPRDPMDHSPPGSSVHGIFQARVLQWGAIAFSDTSLYLTPNCM